MTQRDRFRRAHRHIDAALDDRRPRRLQRDRSRLNVLVDDHPVARLRNRRVGMLAPPCRAKGVALVHGTAIEEVTGDATVGIEPALNLARRERAWNGGGGEQNIAQELWVTCRDRLAGGGHRIARASRTQVDGRAVTEQHASYV